MKVNVATAAPRVYTHEGGRAVNVNALLQLRRSVLACMLWESNFYESGEEVATRIKSLIAQCEPTDVMDLAIEARHGMKLRHVPLLLAREMARLPNHKALVAHTLDAIVDRPDELTEFLAIYWKDGKQPISAQVKKGLSRAFNKFSEYAFAKYDRDAVVKLRDALFLAHAKPADVKKRYTKIERKEVREGERKHKLTPGEELFRKIVDRELETPDTWEVALSSGADKRETFERLIAENKLGALALLRNLRNMQESGVPRNVVGDALAQIKVERVLPFRFIAAARAVPAWEDLIEPAMLRCLEGRDQMVGKTVLLIDISGSMSDPISHKSDLLRVDAACGLAILARELCEEVEVWTFSNHTVPVPPRRGFALRDAIMSSQEQSGTYLGQALHTINTRNQDRTIVITDEQAHDNVGAPTGRGYVINVAINRYGVGYGAWNHIDGWSEAVFDYIIESEQAVA